jgi:radical SAM superfamily enzyme YgiQ (UPF0313 family)
MVVDISESFEIGPIRPPSEAYSLFVRLTRNCPWNRCKFCHIYKTSKFQLRSIEEIKRDIDIAKKCYDAIKTAASQMGNTENMREAAGMLLSSGSNEGFNNVALWLYAGGENVFLQDANSLVMPTDQLVEVLKYLKNTFPSIKRITSYARAHTAARKTVDELRRLHEAGLSRLHLGLESGYDPVLQFMDKGITAADQVKGGKNVVASGISLSEYVLLGAGGKNMWREHAQETARVLNEINPDYIRIRTLTINNQMPLYEEVEKGNFVRSNDEDLAREERVLIENLECTSNFISDHTTNLFQEFDGKLPDDKDKFLTVIDRYVALSTIEKYKFSLGRRMGIYSRLDDIKNADKSKLVEQYASQVINEKPEVIDGIIWELMERFI